MSDLRSPPSAAPGVGQEFTIRPRWRLVGVAMVEVAGEVDVFTAPVLLETARNQLAAGCHTLVLDLAGVRFCSARGIGALVELRHLAEQYEAVVRLLTPTEPEIRGQDLTHTRMVIEGGAPPDPSRLGPARAARPPAVAAGGSGPRGCA